MCSKERKQQVLQEKGMFLLFDAITYPQSFIDHFMLGEWTISLKGIPYHNVAIDEAHECVINKRLKQICCRPSNFRTVQLADFMAYLDVVVSDLENHLSKFKSQASKYTKQYVCERATT